MRLNNLCRFIMVSISFSFSQSYSTCYKQDKIIAFWRSLLMFIVMFVFLMVGQQAVLKLAKGSQLFFKNEKASFSFGFCKISLLLQSKHCGINTEMRPHVAERGTAGINFRVPTHQAICTRLRHVLPTTSSIFDVQCERSGPCPSTVHFLGPGMVGRGVLWNGAIAHAQVQTRVQNVNIQYSIINAKHRMCFISCCLLKNLMCAA